MAALTLFRESHEILWITVTTNVAILVTLSVKSLLQKLHMSSKKTSITAASTRSKTKATSTETNDGDSGYAGSESDSDDDVQEPAPQCRNDSDDLDECDENYDLHRAIRLCQETATPKRAPASPYGEDFEVFSSFLSATEEKPKSGRSIQDEGRC